MATTYWPDEYVQKRVTAQEAISRIKPGQRVFIGSSCGEPQHLVKELAAQRRRLTDIEVVRLLSLESAPLTLISQDDPDSDPFAVRSFYLGSGMPRRLAASRRFHTPINLSAVPLLFSTRRIPLHVALIQTTPPDDFGWMSLGVSVDVTKAAAAAADLVIAQVNPRMPRVLGQGFVHANDVDLMVEHEEELLSVGPPPDFPVAHMIGYHVASLMDDGSTMQISLGATNESIMSACAQKNDLGVHAQFLTDSIMALVARGVITNRRKGLNQGKLVASSAIGSVNLYEFVNDNPAIEFHPSDYVNDPAVIARHNRMFSAQVAETIDLTGQVAADALAYNHYSGVTGICDFVRGAAMSKEGKAVIMLPATSLDGSRSRIVDMLTETPVVVARGDVHYVVTEYGAVNLFGKNLEERALALISIAHPSFRDELFEKAKDQGLIARKRSPSETIHGVYPAFYRRQESISGERVLFRPVKPTDGRLIQEHLYGLDRKDVIARFLHSKARFGADEVEGLFGGDYSKDFTVVAVVGELGFEKVIAIGGYLADPARNMAEVSFSVDRDWQGKGLGKILMDMVAGRARDSGLAGLFAYTAPSNRAMIRLFFSLPYKIKTEFDRDMLTMSLRFNQPAEPKPSECRL
ncbi:MAG: GNAT family N-acetyltransferase [Thermodesulfobacteriota bacterium]